MYYVTGGIYTDTQFTSLEPGTAETYGPFATIEEAKSVWHGKAMAQIDICCHRLRITPIWQG